MEGLNGNCFQRQLCLFWNFKIYSLLAFLPESDVSYFLSDSILRRLFITSNIFSHNNQNNSFLGLVSFFHVWKDYFGITDQFVTSFVFSPLFPTRPHWKCFCSPPCGKHSANGTNCFSGTRKWGISENGDRVKMFLEKNTNIVEKLRKLIKKLNN